MSLYTSVPGATTLTNLFRHRQWVWIGGPGQHVAETCAGQGFLAFYAVRSGRMAFLVSPVPDSESSRARAEKFGEGCRPLRPIIVEAGQCLYVPSHPQRAD